MTEPSVHAGPSPRAQIFAAVSGIIASSLAASLASAPAMAADAAADSGTSGGLGLEEVIVTAQKRTENLQSVPISILAIDSKQLSDLQVASFDDYARYLPSLSVQSYGPGNAQLYIRGVTNGGDGVHVGSQPLVGLYVDEMPVTTIAQNLDVHVYDMARVEALSGPQGTLFGASSMAGTLRLITNKANPAHFDGAIDVTGETFTSGGPGGKLEGYVNLPINDKAAVRLVGWAEHDGGYINVVRSSPQYFPTSGLPRDNKNLVEKNSNSVDTAGGRITGLLKLTDTWTITPTLMTQSQRAFGQYAYTPFPVTIAPTYPNGTTGPSMTLGGTGDLNIARYFPEVNKDDWWMATMVVEGKIGQFDLTYAGGYIKRDSYSAGDYSDYSLFYDVSYPQYYPFVDQNGQHINPSQAVYGWNNFNKQSHELRLATPADWRLHGVVGLFWQRQWDDIRYSYYVKGLAPFYSVDGQPGSVWLERAFRTDRDRAAFTEWTFDVTKKLSVVGGVRAFHYDNTINGYFGFGQNFPIPGAPYSGENICFTPIQPNNPLLPCYDLAYRATKTSTIHRLGANYKIDADRMVYATWSTGYRPGGINRLVVNQGLPVPPYKPDYLANFEAGFKTSWFDHRLRINGALFYERWKDAQFAYPGQGGVNVIINAGRAAIKGAEGEIQFRATEGLTLSTSFTALDAKTLQVVCRDYTVTTPDCNGGKIYAPEGTRLPVSPKFKGNAIARYEWALGSYRAHVQGAAVFQSDVRPALRTSDEAVLGMQPGYATFDFFAGATRDVWTAELYAQNAFDKRGESIRFTGCATSECRLIDVIPVRPRLIGLHVGRTF